MENRVYGRLRERRCKLPGQHLKIINETPNFGNRGKSIYTYKGAIRARNDSEEKFGLLVILDNTNASITATTGKCYKDADIMIKTVDEQQGTEKVLFKH